MTGLHSARYVFLVLLLVFVACAVVLAARKRRD